MPQNTGNALFHFIFTSPDDSTRFQKIVYIFMARKKQPLRTQGPRLWHRRVGIDIDTSLSDRALSAYLLTAPSNGFYALIDIVKGKGNITYPASVAILMRT